MADLRPFPALRPDPAQAARVCELPYDVMSSQEARFINEQANLGFIKLAEKPTTIAIQKFKDGKLEIIKESDAG